MTQLTAKDLARKVGVPLELHEHEAKRKPMELTFHRVVIGGEPVKFNEQDETIIIAGTPFTAEEWITLRNRVDLSFAHLGVIKKAPEPSRAHAASNFLTANLNWINSAKVGKIKSPPPFIYSSKTEAPESFFDGKDSRLFRLVARLFGRRWEPTLEDYSGVIGKEEVDYGD